MRVGVYVGDASPDIGGGYTFVHDVLAELDRRRAQLGHEFVVLTTAPAPAGSGTFEVVSLAEAVADRSTRARHWLGATLDRLLTRTPAMLSEVVYPPVKRALAAARLDVIWYLTPAVCLSQDLPYITVVWDLQHRLQPQFPEVSAGVEGLARDDIYRTVLGGASLVIAGTEVGRAEIQRFYGVDDARIRILPHPTPAFALEAAGTAASARPTVAPPDPYLFYPAQFWPHKNHVNLLEAVARLRLDGLPVHLALSGSDKGNLAYIRETAVRLKIAEAVHFLGFVERADLIGLYRHALALAYVTFFGPENLPTLEAFALGCPVVASDVPGAREQLGDAALLVDPRSPVQIAEAVRQLAEMPGARADLVERGRLRAHRFTSKDFVGGVVGGLDEFVAVRRCWPGSGA
jgi:glycosyltransferase involved in cell wall biosynthesis